MGMHERLVDELTEQFNQMKPQITIEMLENTPQMIATKMIIETFKGRGVSKEDALHIIANSNIEITVLPENLQNLLDAFVDIILHVKTILTDAGYPQTFVDATTKKFSLELS